MATRRQQKLFDSLNLNTAAPETNPFDDLGLSRGVARELLENGNKAAGREALSLAASALYRTLSRVYRQDIEPLAVGNSSRLTKIQRAHERIGAAEHEALLSWSREEQRSPDSSVVTALESRLARTQRAVDQAANILGDGFAVGRHPNHFSQLPLAHGVLLKRGESFVLTRPMPDQGISVLPSSVIAVDESSRQLFDPGTTRPPASDIYDGFGFLTFMRRNQSFGLEPGMKVGAFLEEGGRTSLLRSDLSFLMDVTAASREYQEDTARRDPIVAIHTSQADSQRTTLFTTTVPIGTADTTSVNVMTFSKPQRGEDPTWNHPTLEVVGSVGNDELFTGIRSSTRTGMTAIEAAHSDRYRGLFNFFGLPLGRLLESEDSGYSPVLEPGNRLLLYDMQTGTPLITDAKIIGMIGSNAIASS